MFQSSFTRRLSPLLMMLLLCGPIPAQINSAPTRIEVRPGGPAVTVEGDVEKGKEVSFVFRARAGLRFSGHLTTKSGNAGFSLDDADGKGLPEEEFDFNTDLTQILLNSHHGGAPSGNRLADAGDARRDPQCDCQSVRERADCARLGGLDRRSKETSHSFPRVGRVTMGLYDP